MMEKYGVEKEEVKEYCVRKVRAKEMSIDEAIQKCKKHGLEISKEELKGYV